MKQQIRQRNVVVEWGDVKNKFLAVVGDGKPWGGVNSTHSTAGKFVRAGNNPDPLKCDHTCAVAKGEGDYCPHMQDRYETTWNDRTKKHEKRLVEHRCKYCIAKAESHWEGAMFSDTLHYLRNGYRAPEFEHSAAYVPMAERKRPSWAEEPDGDLDLGRLYGGYDNPYLVQAEQEKKPGLRVMIEYAFAAGMQAKTIEQYGAWVAGLLGALESTGYDLVVDMWIQLDNLFVDPGRSGNRDNVLVRVKRQNEVSNFTEWSALFSPGGYRHVGFCAKLVAGDKIGLKCAGGLGHTLAGQTWGLEYDKDESILKIRVDQRGAGMFGGNEFPRESLNTEAVKLGLIPEAIKQN